MCALHGRVSRNKSAQRCRARCSAIGQRGAKIRRSGEMPRRRASLRRLSTTHSLSRSSHNTEPGTVSSKRIQIALADKHLALDETTQAHLEESRERIQKVLTASMQVND